MKRRRRPTRIAAGLTALALAGVGAAALVHDQTGEAAGQPTRLAAATLIVEVNATDGDAGLQFFLDGEPWNSMTISDPSGRVIVDVDAEGRLKDWGLTELFSESNEPPFTEVPLAEFKARFPQGRYEFVGETIEGDRLVGTARLSHDIPDGPKIIEPADGATVSPDNVVARWQAPPEPPGIDIVGYRVIATREDPLRVYSVELPASARSVPIPAAFLQADTEYELEIQAIEESGNWTFTTSFFVVN
jgi:Fibronectin type III domain